jgi:DTW domain-containing protein YfiP
MCPRCDRPSPVACICAALPNHRIRLRRSHCLILQHPQELQRKNRSLPFVQLCLDSSSLQVVESRRLGDTTDPSFLQRLHDPSNAVWLLYPCKSAISLSRAIQQLNNIDSNNITNNNNSIKVTLLFLDATWKYAKEMNVYNTQRTYYPHHLQCVQLDGEDFARCQPGRFEIRTPPGDEYMSTAECVAWVLARVEDDMTIYDTIVKPMDLMVAQWRVQREKKHAAVECQA